MSDSAGDLAATLNLDHDDLWWLRDTACDFDTNPVDQFFVDAGHTIMSDVLNMCRGCPVRKECLIHAYQHNYTSGYFAGLSPSRRASMTLEQALAFIETDTARFRSQKR